eukprot:m.460148 g.460148  ORF g.460148 m.460148 type:complete len:245 (+) comp21950_c0_seq1:221-955(+)
MVDYSRFDKIDVSSDEDEDERGPPGVYRVGDGESVTIPGRNVQITNTQGSAAAKGPATAVRKVPDGKRGQAAAALPPPAPHTLNGGTADGYLWAQDPTTVTLHAFVPTPTKASELSIRVTATTLTIGRNDGDAVLIGEWYGDVEPPEDETDLDWEMASATTATNAAQRCVRVTVNKVSAVRGVVAWWKAALKGGTEIDIDTIPGRAKMAHKNRQFREAFAEAQAMFAAKMKDREDDRVEVDVDE